MGMVYEALLIAVKAHKGQVDKQGVSYISHPMAVADMVTGELERTVAYLHDVVEDTATTLEELAEIFPEEVIEALDAISRRKGEETYFEYITRVEANPIAKAVKLADLKHNMLPERAVKGIAEGLIKRYQKAWDTLGGDDEV